MLIGELSKKSGLSRDTIRFYEKQGLISVGRKERRVNNYKEYSEETLHRLSTIKTIKGFGFTLNETAGFLELIGSRSASCGDIAQLIQEKVHMVEQKIQELHALKHAMIQSVNSCLVCCSPETAAEDCNLLPVRRI